MRKGLACLLFAPSVWAPSVWAAASFEPRQLRCEYRQDPEGVDTARPRLSWILAPADPAARGLSQKAYRILVATSEAALAAGRGDLWDSGPVPSAESTLVAYAGKPLASGARAFWKVRVWDHNGAPSDWSAPARWSMGLLHAEDWKGQWIGLDATGLSREGSPYRSFEGARWIGAAAGAEKSAGNRYFRYAFSVPGDRAIARAAAIFGASDHADVYLNGAEVARASSATIPQVNYVTHLLHTGENVLAIEVARGQDSTRSGLLGALVIEFRSGPPLLIRTSGGWRTAVEAGSGWEQPGFSDASWKAASDLGPFGSEPWKDTPLVTEHRLPARQLRKEFSVDGRVRRAVVYYSGLGLSELWLNGAKVGDHVLSPGLTDYDRHVLYETFDVTGALVPGRNAIGLWLGNGRYHAPRLAADTRNFGDPKAILELNIEYEDGRRREVVTDSSWRITTLGAIRANNEYDGEEYDARKETTGWTRAGFDARSWQPAEVVDAPLGVLVSEMAEPLRVTETRQPVSVKRLAPGVWIFDMGQNMVGWARLRVSGSAGARVTLRFAETLRPDGSLYTANLRSARALDTYILKGGGTELYEPRFTYHGFRYVELTGLAEDGDRPAHFALEGRVVHDDLARSADFTSSNDLLNRIHQNIFWGVRGNYRSIPTDCPQRDERQGWLGDRSEVSRGESYLFDVAAFYTKWERDLADSQRYDGAFSDVTPNYWPLYQDDLTWPSTFLFIPGMLYEQYGDRRPLERAWPVMKKWMTHIATYAKDGLISQDQYGDWCVPPENPKLIHSQDPARITNQTLIATAYYYRLLMVMSEYARLLARPLEASSWVNQAAAVNQAFQKKFFRPTRKTYDNGTETASILPLSFGMVPDEDRAAVVESLVDRIRTKSHGHVATGLVGAQWLMRTLSDSGHADLAYEIATARTYPGWGYMVERGATTIWELWNGDTADPAMNSGNHVMQIGDLGVWMYEYLAGIRSDPAAPGFRHTLLRPVPAGDLTFVKASHETPFGTIVSSWKRAAGVFTVEVTIPANTTATVWVPTRDARTVTESGRPASEAKGVRSVGSEPGAAVFAVGSGRYSFRARQ